MEVGFNYGFDEDSVIRLQKDLNHLLTNLDSQNVKKLYTEYCDISSKKGETIIDGPLIDMHGFNTLTSMASTILRLRMGYDASTSNFVFKLYNDAGIETISLDAAGNAIFSGSVYSSVDVHVGNNLFMGLTDSPEYKGVYFNTTTPTTDPFSVDVTGLLWDKVNDSFNLMSTGSMQIRASSAIDIATKDIAILTGGEAVSVGIYTTASSWTNSFEATSSGLSVISYNVGTITIATPGDLALGYYSTVSMAFENAILCTSNGVFLDHEDSTSLIAARGWVMPKVVRRFSSTSRISSTIPLGDSVLYLDLDANSLYSLECHISYFSTATGQRLITSWSTDNMATWVSRECFGLSTDSTNTRGPLQAVRVNLGDTVRYGCPTQGGGTANLTERAIVSIDATPATFYFRWAQKVASTTPMTLSGNSYLMATRVQT
jgi:hypothetical protein